MFTFLPKLVQLISLGLGLNPSSSVSLQLYQAVRHNCENLSVFQTIRSQCEWPVASFYKIPGNNFSRLALSLKRQTFQHRNHFIISVNENEWKQIAERGTSFFLHGIPTIIIFYLSAHNFFLLPNGHYWLLFKGTKTKHRAVDFSANSKHTIFKRSNWQKSGYGKPIQVNPMQKAVGRGVVNQALGCCHAF